jgi:hypothetical protein
MKDFLKRWFLDFKEGLRHPLKENLLAFFSSIRVGTKDVVVSAAMTIKSVAALAGLFFIGSAFFTCKTGWLIFNLAVAKKEQTR